MLSIPQHVLYANPLYPIKINGKYGFIDRNGNISIQAIYSGATDFNDNGQAIVIYSEKRGIINLTGQYIIPPIYSDVGNISEGIIPINNGGSWGFLNMKGEQIVEPKYLDAKEFSDGVAAVKFNTYGFFDDNGKFNTTVNKYGFINNTGKIVINPVFDNVIGFSKGITCVKEFNLWKIINKYSVPINKSKYTECRKVKNGLVYVKNKDINIVLDNTGAVLLEMVVDDVGFFSEGYFVVYETDFYSKSGKREVIESSFRKNDLVQWGRTRDGTLYRRNLGEAEFYDPGGIKNEHFLYPTPNGRNAYYINMQGEKIGNYKYFDAKPFSEGLAAVRLLEYNNLWGYINKLGKLVIEPKFEFAGNFRYGLALIKNNGEENYINKGGNLIIKTNKLQQ